MKFKLTFLLFAGLYFNNYCQIVSGQNPFWYDLMPTTSNMSGIGNLGFDEFDNIYNPKVLKERKSIVSVSCMSNLFVKNSETNAILTENKMRFAPDIKLSYNPGKVTVHFSYLNNLLFGSKQITGVMNLYFPTLDGTNSIRSQNWISKVSNKIIQTSVAYDFNDQLSLSCGVLWNNYNLEIDYPDPYSSSESKWNSELPFSKIQYLGSINYKISNIKSYLIFKSQLSRVEISNKLFVDGVDQNIVDVNSFISYPGLIAYGIQYSNLFNSVDFSLELNHNFLVDEGEYTIPNSYDKIKYNIDNWDNVISPGISYRLLDNLKFGMVFSYYYKFKNRSFRIADPYGNETNFKVNPFYLVFSTEYSFLNYKLSYYIQYGQTKTNFFTNWWFKDEALLSKISLTALF